MILELSLMVVVSIGEAMISPPVNQSPSSECQPDEVCYPIDPNPEKPLPSNCFRDEEGNITCYPVDDSGKF